MCLTADLVLNRIRNAGWELHDDTTRRMKRYVWHGHPNERRQRHNTKEKTNDRACDERRFRYLAA